MPQFRCDHIHLKAVNVEETAQWYVDVLGARITFRGQFRGSAVCYLDISGFTLIVFGRLEGEDGDSSPIPPTLRTRFGADHFGFAVDDMAQAVAHLRAKGVRILEEPWSPRAGLTICYIEGPDKARIELTQRS